MPSSPVRALYIHGFKSSPASHKAQAFRQYCRSRHPHLRVEVPSLSHDPALAMQDLEEAVGGSGEPPRLLVGSSLGGYYATWLSERFGVKAALINPAVAPHRTIGREVLGWHTNPYSGERFEMTLAHGEALARFEVKELRHPENFLLLAQTGDEVLDYRLAVEKYAGCEQVIRPGGSHAFEEFESMIPRILAFSGLDGMRD